MPYWFGMGEIQSLVFQDLLFLNVVQAHFLMTRINNGFKCLAKCQSILLMDTKNGLGVIKSFPHTVVLILEVLRTVVLILEKTKFRLLLHSLMVIVFLLLLNSRFEFLYYISFYIHD